MMWWKRARWLMRRPAKTATVDVDQLRKELLHVIDLLGRYLFDCTGEVFCFRSFVVAAGSNRLKCLL
jgi:hypothetical protein